MRAIFATTALLVFVAIWCCAAPGGKPKNANKPRTPRQPATSNAPLFVVAHETATDVFAITTAVLVQQPPRFGVNVNFGKFTPWTPTRCLNIWNTGGNCEPIGARIALTLKNPAGSTPDTIVEVGRPGASAGLSFWGTYPSGFWNGADAKLYRITNGAYALIHHARVKTFVGEKAVNEKLVLATPGPIAQTNDIVVLTTTLNQLPLADQKKAYGLFAPTDQGVSAVIDPHTKAPEGDSTASLKIALPGAARKPAGMGHGMFQKTLYYILPPPALQLELWMKQAGMASGTVTVLLEPFLNTTVTVGADWKKYTFAVPVDRAKVGKQAGKFLIGSTEKGTLWIDNVVVREPHLPPFALRPNHLRALQEYRPGCIRLWDGLRAPTLDAWLTDGLAQPSDYFKKGFGHPDGGSLPGDLALCQAVGADPWLIVQPFFDDAELQHLMEYLGAPADIGYGKLRAQHGHPTPWIAVFSNIYIECCNEPWNGNFTPYAWPGPQVALYAAVANRTFALLKQSPYYTTNHFKCVVGGWSGGAYRHKDYKTGAYKPEASGKQWSLQIAELATQADLVDYANYYGGADGVTILGQNDQDLYQGNMLYAQHIVAPQMQGAAALREEIARTQAGRTIGLAMYEGGPGYPLPGPGKTYLEDGEMIGKSMALGVTTLDAYLTCQALGFGHLAYFTYGCGNNWKSHSDEDRMIPYPSWRALMLRNQVCAGAMMVVSNCDVKTIDIPTQTAEKLDYKGNKKMRTLAGVKNIPLVGCFAYQDGKTHAIVLLNRSFAEPRTVTLQLPYEPAPIVKRYLLASADPRAHNRFEENVILREDERKDCARHYTVTLPPAAIMVLVNQAR